MNETFTSIDRLVKKGIDFLNRHGAYTSTEEIRERNREFKTSLLQRFQDFLPENPIGVDIGAADGMMSEIMYKYNSIAVDPIPKVDAGNKTPFIRAIAEKLPFSDESLDYATVLYSFHHFFDSKKALKECARVLKKNGLLVIMEEFLRYPGQEYFLRINDISVNNIVFGNWKQEDIDKYTSTINYFKKEELEKFMTSLGLEVVDYEKYPPTKRWDIAFKSSKNFYVLRKTSVSAK